jgi:peptide/nickel transport system substrate-binding protein
MLNLLSRRSFACLLVTAGLFGSLSGSANSISKATNQELRIGTGMEIDNIHPSITNSTSSMYVVYMVNRSFLVSLDAAGKWYPVLAESIPTLENGGAKRVTVNGKETIRATWKIRKNAVWGDGTPITAKDFILAWNIGKADTVTTPDREIYSMVEKIEVDPKDPKTMIYTYDKLRADFAGGNIAQFPAMPSHIEGKVFEEHGKVAEGYEKNTKYIRDITNKGLHSGPYRVQELKLGSHIILVPNEKYWGEKPKIQKIIVRFISNSASIEPSLLTGNIHFAAARTGFTLDQAIQFEKKIEKEKLPFKTLFKEGSTYRMLQFLTTAPHLSDVRVRKAIAYGIDRPSLVKSLYDGKVNVAHHFIHPIDPWYTDDPKIVTKYTYSQRTAKKLLAEAGYKPGKDGILEKDGKPLTIRFMTSAGIKMVENIQAYVKDQLKSIGIQIEIKNEPPRVLLSTTLEKLNYGGIILYANVSNPEYNPKASMHSSGIPSEKNGWKGQNYSAWQNAKVDAATDALDLEFDNAKRKELAATILKEYTNELPFLTMIYDTSSATIPNNLENHVLSPHQFQETLNVEKWNLK